MSEILTEDFNYIISEFAHWDRLDKSTVLVTGGTGFLGSLLIRLLDYARKTKSLELNIIALVRSHEKADRILGGCEVTYLVGDMNHLPPIAGRIDYIFHTAAVTKSKEMIEKPVEVSAGIIDGTINICTLARDKKVKSMVNFSSMEVYGKTDPAFDYVKEENLGYLEIKSTRSCYPLAKRMAENICFSFCNEYQVPVKTARLAQIFGAGILPEETRVFSQFAKSAINGQNIILHTDGASTGNYCYTADALLAILILLISGMDGEIYNVSNEATCMTIRQMAELVVEHIADNKIEVICEILPDKVSGYGAPVNMRLSSEKIRSLGWKPVYGMEAMYQRMIADMQEH